MLVYNNPVSLSSPRDLRSKSILRGIEAEETNMEIEPISIADLIEFIEDNSETRFLRENGFLAK
jgi:hypothetical protein